MRTQPTVLFTAFALVACAKAAPPPSTTLGPGADTLRVPFSEITQGVWLGSGRFAVVSPADDSVAIVDFDSSTVRMLGRGAAEIQHAAAIFALAETLFVADWGMRRVTAWGPGGKLARTIAASDVARGALPRAIDARGRLYYELAPAPGRDGSGNRDSSALLRAASPTARPDTIARLAPLDIAEVQGDQGRRFERRIFSGDDEWGVLPDATVWVARTYQNRVDWIDTTGSVRHGEPLPDRVLEVTRTDRERFVQRFPAELRQSAERLPFSPIKAPFVHAFAGEGGDVWLEKSRWIRDTTQLYHRVGRVGRLLQEVKVPGWGRIVAASAASLLVAVSDSAGFVLMQVPRP